MKKIPLFLIVTLFLVPFLSLADQTQIDCKALNYQELVRCAESNSSEIQIAEQQLKSAQKLENIAGQWVNPELDADTVSKGSDRSETNAALFFTLRLGGKSNALIGEAQSEIERAKAGRDLGVSSSRLDLMLALYRLSHLKSEIRIEDESVETFTKIVKQYQRRQALSPEQNVSLSVFRMALSDHQLRLAKLKADEEKSYLSLIAVTRLSRATITKNLPTPRQNWPQIEMSTGDDSSPQVRVALAELKLARSQKQKAEGDSWPDLRIGPAVKTVKENGESNTFVGFGLSLPIPVFNQNSAGRAYGAQRIIEAELSAEQTKRKSAAVREELVNRYNQIVMNLKSSLSPSVINKNHEQIEAQFFKGLVSSSLVIEAHRQLFDLEERRNASEFEALESLGRILILDNKFNEVIL